MRIGVDVRCLAEGKRTGVEEYTLSLLSGLFEFDRENEYILFFNAWNRDVPVFVSACVARYPNVTLKAFRFPNKLLNLSLWYLHFPKLDRLIGGTDIFFLPNLNFASVSDRTKLVVTAHDLSFELFPETFSLKRRIWHFFINFRRLALSADRVIAVSRSTGDDMMTYYGVQEDRITVIESGIGEQFHMMSRNDAELVRVQEKYRLPYRFILSLATLEPRKNILALIQAYEALLSLKHPALEKYSLVIAGTRGWKCEEIFETIAHSPHKDKILLPGFIEDADKTALYNLSSAFVYPSLYEGFGFPPLEAMASGVPVIASHSSSLPEVVGSAGILIDPYQPDELLSALKQVLTDQALAESMRGKSLERAKQFTWDKTVHATYDIFRLLA
ncbi:MAG: glycosyltransferase family 1 protein [Candidatus Moraniibacteriota bacterium]